MNLRIYYYAPTPARPGCLLSPGNNTIGICKTIWDGMTAAQSAMGNDDYVDYGWREWVPGHPEIEATGVTSGGVVIYDWDRKVALKKFLPSQVSTSAIKTALLQIWPLEYNPATGEYIDPNGNTLPAITNAGEGFNFFPGLGLFDINFPFPFPWWAWAIVAGLGAWQANKSTTKAGRYTFGAVAVVAAGNAWMKKVKPA